MEKEIKLGLVADLENLCFLTGLGLKYYTESFRMHPLECVSAIERMQRILQEVIDAGESGQMLDLTRQFHLFMSRIPDTIYLRMLGSSKVNPASLIGLAEEVNAVLIRSQDSETPYDPSKDERQVNMTKDFFKAMVYAFLDVVFS